MIFALSAWFALALITGMVALFAVWSRRETKYRFLSVLAFLIVTILSGGIILLSMGWATPCKFNVSGEYEILGYTAVPDKMIFLFIDTAYGPKVCSLPWNTTKLKQLEDGKEENGGHGSKLKTKTLGGLFDAAGEANIWNDPPEPVGKPKERPLAPLVNGVQ